MSLPAGVDKNEDVTRCAVVVNIQQEADIQLKIHRKSVGILHLLAFSLLSDSCKRFCFVFPLYLTSLKENTKSAALSLTQLFQLLLSQYLKWS